MKFKFTAATAFMLVSMIATAQLVSKDSINILKQQKSALVLGQQLNDNKLQLAKLENSLEKQSGKMLKAQEEAQKSADDNAETAAKLSSDASDRKLAKRARKGARSAERSAKQARKEAANLKDLQNDIDSLKKEIAAQEEKLVSMPSLPLPVSGNNK